jgi:predicted component of type VI protein secretion system
VLLLKQEAIPDLELESNKYKQLGWTTWLKSGSRNLGGHVADIHLNSEQFKKI